MEAYSEEQSPRAPHHGCLWGCLGGFVAVAVVLMAVFGYGAWYFYKGFSNDSRIALIVSTMRENGQAVAVLGKDIQVREVQLHTFDYATGRGGTASYVLNVEGSHDHGTVKADLDISHQPKIKLLILTDSEGRSYYLIGAPPPNPMMQNSI